MRPDSAQLAKAHRFSASGTSIDQIAEHLAAASELAQGTWVVLGPPLPEERPSRSLLERFGLERKRSLQIPIAWRCGALLRLGYEDIGADAALDVAWGRVPPAR